MVVVPKEVPAARTVLAGTVETAVEQLWPQIAVGRSPQGFGCGDGPTPRWSGGRVSYAASRRSSRTCCRRLDVLLRGGPGDGQVVPGGGDVWQACL
ncbi:hypothetical protein GCM10009541_50260 [Micromonospora gifhornensis]